MIVPIVLLRHHHRTYYRQRNTAIHDDTICHVSLFFSLSLFSLSLSLSLSLLFFTTHLANTLYSLILFTFPKPFRLYPSVYRPTPTSTLISSEVITAVYGRGSWKG